MAQIVLNFRYTAFKMPLSEVNMAQILLNCARGEHGSNTPQLFHRWIWLKYFEIYQRWIWLKYSSISDTTFKMPLPEVNMAQILLNCARGEYGSDTPKFARGEYVSNTPQLCQRWIWLKYSSTVREGNMAQILLKGICDVNTNIWHRVTRLLTKE